MSECTDEVFHQEAGLVCKGTIEIEKLKKENDILREAVEKIKLTAKLRENRAYFSIVNQALKKCEGL